MVSFLQDVCYTAVSGLHYCWCSSKDLCNNSAKYYISTVLLLLLILHQLFT